MTTQFANHAFDQSAKLFKGAVLPVSLRAITEQGVASSKIACDKACALAQGQRRALTEMVEAAWVSSKSLNEMAVRNLEANLAAGFAAAQQIATAKSLPAMAKLQIDFAQMIAAQATAQTKELVGCSVRASQDAMTKLHAAVMKSFTPGA